MPQRVLNRLTDRLAAARHNRFVGRAPERELFQSALQSEQPPFCVLHIYGPGGIGKTTLLREFALLCQTHQTRAVFLDAREIEPSPAAFEAALSQALGTERAPLEFLSAQTQRHALLIDTFERFAPLDNWLRETFLPQLPDGNLVVLAGRHAPRAAWKLDSGWSSLLRAVPLRNLSPDESHNFLEARRIPAAQRNRVLDFTHGHPLALGLVADAFEQGAIMREEAAFHPADAPDTVRLLVAHLVDEMPTPRHRAALEACALVHWTNESLLTHLLELDEASGESAALFDWLHSLSFIESGAQGVMPHDMAREALAANLRWRNPQAHADYHRRARAFYATQLKRASVTEQQKVLADYIFLHHSNAVIRPFLEWQENGDLNTSTAREDDLPALKKIVRRHEGAESARLFEYWFARQRENVLVLRGHQSQIEGFLFALALHGASDQERDHDPATQAAWNYLQRAAPLRRGEGATMFRFWMARDAYQGVSPAQSLIFINIVRHYLTTPALALTFLPVADAEFWAPIFAYALSTRLSETDFQIGEHCYGVYGHDWRSMPAFAWLDKLAANETAETSDATTSDSTSSTRNAPSLERSSPLTPVLLSEEGFVVAVRDALKNLARPAVLAGNPLLRSRLLLERIGDEALATSQKIALLQQVLREACEVLRASGRTEKWYQALHWRYLEPAATQEAAADKMDVPFSTFRRYLKSGLERVTEELWRAETGDQTTL